MVLFFSNLYTSFNLVQNVSILTSSLILLLTLQFFLFLKSKTSFFKALILIFYIILNSLVLVAFSLDFFSGFLLVSELPLALICLLFIFQKNSIQIDDIYKFNKNNTNFYLFLLLYGFTLILSFCFLPSSVNCFFFEINNQDFISFYTRSDLSIFFIIFYYFNISFLLIIGYILFIVSFVVIFYFFLNNQFFFFKKILKKNKNFIKNQNFLKQSIFPTFFTFFKKK